jgi:TRAP-type C4-dicarboxylate transport system substrate-binding protein
VQGGKFFMDRATALSNGRIKFEWYPAEQLGKAKDLLALVQTGVADMADVVPGYVPDKLPLSGVAELPGQISNFVRRKSFMLDPKAHSAEKLCHPCSDKMRSNSSTCKKCR